MALSKDSKAALVSRYRENLNANFAWRKFFGSLRIALGTGRIYLPDEPEAALAPILTTFRESVFARY